MVARALLAITLAGVHGGCEMRPASVSAAPRAASVQVACEVPLVEAHGRCLAPGAAYTAPGGTAYVVDAQHPEADDAGPGTAARPWRTISRAAHRGALRPGDAVLIREGVYRESVRPEEGGSGPEARITYAAYPGDQVIVTGADVTTDRWHRLGDGTWALNWYGPALPTYAEEDVFRREMVIAGGDVLWPAFQREDLRPGTFWAEGPPEAPRRLVAQFPGDASPAEAGTVEVAVRASLFLPLGSDPYADCGAPETPGWLRVVGITFRHAANRAQWGAFCAGSRGALMEDVRVEWTNGLGVDASGTGHTFLRTEADLNGQMGWGGACTDCLIEDGSAVGNNWKGYDPLWEAGGGKWVQTSGTTIRRHLAAYNDGPGIWLDIDNRDNTIEGALVVGNEVAGVMLELRTTGTLVQHSTIVGTRQREWSGAGILSQAASDNLLLHNTVVENEGTGVWLRLDPDRRAPDGRTLVVHNRIVGNATEAEEAREIQVEGRTLRDVRSHRLDGNVYGSVIGDGVLRSTFFLWTASGEATYRGDDLREWRRRLGGDTQSNRAGDSPSRVLDAEAIVPWEGGALGARPVITEAVGADLSRVRNRGEWRSLARPRVPDWFSAHRPSSP